MRRAPTSRPGSSVLVTFGAVMFTVGSLFVLVNNGGRPDALELALSLTAVALGWLTIHTMTALHYAHLYWRPRTGSAKWRPDGEHDRPGRNDEHGGLEFPGDGEPDGYDFLYIRW